MILNQSHPAVLLRDRKCLDGREGLESFHAPRNIRLQSTLFPAIETQCRYFEVSGQETEYVIGSNLDPAVGRVRQGLGQHQELRANHLLAPDCDHRFSITRILPDGARGSSSTSTTLATTPGRRS